MSAISPFGHSLTAVQHRSQASKKGRKSKYKAMREVVDGLKFDSKHEARVWCELRIKERAGEISNLRRQVPYQLYASTRDGAIVGDVTVYVADFVYIDTATNEEVVADAKGVITQTFALKKKMMKVCHNIEIQLL